MATTACWRVRWPESSSRRFCDWPEIRNCGGVWESMDTARRLNVSMRASGMTAGSKSWSMSPQDNFIFVKHARGAFWTLVGAAAARVLRIPISVLLARLMGPTNYGELGIASTSIDLFGLLAGLGLGMTATKYVAELRTKDPARAGRIIAISTVVAGVGGSAFAIALFIFAPWLAAHTLAAPQLTVPLRIGTG